mmetsp:Transcript_18713/g.34886  ORF Transcript_18713/g.34886 Transcript_18713/m.34886 type:complete len:124 (-) Transcript_18713:854-1225(-)
MLARGMIGNPGQPAALLIAPTSSLVATISLQTDAALRIGHTLSPSHTGLTGGGAVDSTTRVHVVHGSYDGSFCPDQNRWCSIPGVKLHILPDNHLFCSSSSLRQLTLLLSEIIDTEKHDGGQA